MFTLVDVSAIENLEKVFKRAKIEVSGDEALAIARLVAHLPDLRKRIVEHVKLEESKKALSEGMKTLKPIESKPIEKKKKK